MAPATLPPRPPADGVTIWSTGLHKVALEHVDGLLLSAFPAAVRYAGPREAFDAYHRALVDGYRATAKE